MLTVLPLHMRRREAMKQMDNKGKIFRSFNSPYVARHFYTVMDTEVHRTDGSKLRVAYSAQQVVGDRKLQDFLLQFGSLELSVAKFFIRQLLRGLCDLHKSEIALRSINLEQIKLENLAHAKLTCLDFASKCGPSRFSQNYIAVPGFTAPEITDFQAGGYRADQADVFALAIVMYILTCEAPNYLAAGEASENNNGYLAFVSCDRKNFPTDSFEHLFVSMIALNPSQRISAEEALAHEWLNTDVASKEKVMAYMTQMEQKLQHVEDYETPASASMEVE